MPLTTGQTLGAFEIVDAIGAGGMGEVYKARNTRLDRTVAIKVLTRWLRAVSPKTRTTGGPPPSISRESSSTCWIRRR